MNQARLHHLATCELVRARKLCEGTQYDGLLRRVDFQFNTRLTSTLGRAYLATGLVELSTKPFQEMEERDFVDTVRHELAHLIAPKGSGHGQEWKRAAVHLGATPKARSKSRKATPRYKKDYWAVITCPGCFTQLLGKLSACQAWAGNPTRQVVAYHSKCGSTMEGATWIPREETTL